MQSKQQISAQNVSKKFSSKPTLSIHGAVEQVTLQASGIPEDR